MNNVYVDELMRITEIIRIRKSEEYLMQLAIATNPHIEKQTERRKLWDALLRESKEPVPEKLDKSGFERFKQTIMRTSKSIRVK